MTNKKRKERLQTKLTKSKERKDKERKDKERKERSTTRTKIKERMKRPTDPSETANRPCDCW
jgi:hypothetical protein